MDISPDNSVFSALSAIVKRYAGSVFPFYSVNAVEKRGILLFSRRTFGPPGCGAPMRFL